MSLKALLPLLLPLLLVGEIGVAGNGFAVPVERELGSVLELLAELKREVASFLAMVTRAFN